MIQKKMVLLETHVSKYSFGHNEMWYEIAKAHNKQTIVTHIQACNSLFLAHRCAELRSIPLSFHLSVDRVSSSMRPMWEKDILYRSLCERVEYTTSTAEMKRAKRILVGKRTELADKLHNICTNCERCLCLYTLNEWYTQMVWHLPFNIWVFSTSSAVVGLPAHFERRSTNKINFKHTHNKG